MLVSDIMMSILPIIDNLEKAISTGTKDTAYEEGIKMVLKQLKDTLTYHGVKEIETVGKPFDPELHEAVSDFNFCNIIADISCGVNSSLSILTFLSDPISLFIDITVWSWK